MENVKRSFPFWAWNSKVNKKEIKSQVAIFKKMGYGGFVIHPRTGLETEYLSKEWFSLVNYAINQAKKNDMEVFLYDEDRYPSGTCGGRVTVEPKYQEKHLCVTITNNIIMENCDSAIAVFTATFDGEYLVDYKKYSDGDKGTFLVFYTINSSPSTYFNNSPYIDTLSLDATKRFLELTHEKYKKYCGKHLGKTVKGIFTDEVHYAHTFCNEVVYYNEKKNYKTAYTTDLFERFFDKYGYDLKEKLPELFFKKKGEDYRKISWQYINLVQELFIDRFAKPYNEWCIKNNISFIGHVLQEDSLSSQTSSCGSCMHYYEYMGIAGVDMLREEPNTDWIYKQVSSITKQLKKDFSLCECYGATGYKVTLSRYKVMNDILSLYDIDLRVPHLAPFSLKGRCKRDYPANLSKQTCGYEKLKLLEDYSYKLNTLLKNGQSVTDICVVSPIESVWALASVGAFRDECYDGKSNIVKSIDIEYYDTFNKLVANNVDFDYTDESIISSYGSVKVKDNIPYFSIGQMDYKVISIFGNRILRKSTFDLLVKFAKMGGVVVVSNNLSLVDFEKIESLPKEFVLVNSIDEMCKKLKQNSLLSITTNGKVLTNIKKTPFGYYLFAFNSDRHNEITSDITINGKFFVSEIDLFNDTNIKADYSSNDKTTTIKSLFYNGQSKLYKLCKIDENLCENKSTTTFSKKIEIDSFDYELTSDNILLLDSVRYFVNSKEMGKDYVLTVDSLLRSKFFLEQKKEMMCQPYFKAKYQSAYNDKLCDLKLEYDFNIKTLPKDVFLALEQNELVNVFLNDQPIEKQVAGEWIDCAFTKLKLPIDKLKLGKNKITLTLDYKDEVNIEGIFLLGNFGVQKDNSTIISLPKKLNVGSIVEQALPYYSDAIIYKTGIKSGNVKVKINEPSAFAVSLLSGDKEYDISFYPFEKAISLDGELKIKLYLSRQNTFGAIHNKNNDISWNGPFTFIDVKNGLFTTQHNLQPQGLMSLPIIEME